MLLSEDVAAAIRSQLGNLHSIKPVSGGSINQCYQIKTDTGLFFLKVNSADMPPDFFLAEAEGLKRIRKTGAIAVPDVIAHGKAGREIFLILDWINSAGRDNSQYLLEQQLAKMYTHKAENFGLDHDNYIGSLGQKNQWNISWYEFFVTRRLEPQLKLAVDKNLISSPVKDGIITMLTKLQTLFPPEPPSLVHGDLWSGNYIIDTLGTPFLIDPAVYFGNREMDIAMSTLFGGFTADFFQGYNDEFPLQSGWQDRLDIWNLYPLLIHLNLFGAAYLASINATLKKFS